MDPHQLDGPEQTYEYQKAINDLLQLSFKEMPLNKLLDKALRIILSISWLMIEKRGCIFLVEPGQTQRLIMTAQAGIDSENAKMCRTIPFNSCLCGKAAETGKIIFKNKIDEQHDFQIPGLRPHGHFIAPIIHKNELLGILNVFLKSGHKWDLVEEEFFRSAAHTLANLIMLHKTENMLRSLFHFTEENPHPAFKVDQDGTIAYANRSAKELFGFWKLNPANRLPDLWLPALDEVLKKRIHKEITISVNDVNYQFLLKTFPNHHYVYVYG
jgi:putative methionine-R-sulfoxide reductase with GAF domain